MSKLPITNDGEAKSRRRNRTAMSVTVDVESVAKLFHVEGYVLNRPDYDRSSQSLIVSAWRAASDCGEAATPGMPTIIDRRVAGIMVLSWRC